jgi:hypothetical protein
MLRKAGIVALLISERCIHHALVAVGTLRSAAESSSRQALEIAALRGEVDNLTHELEELRSCAEYSDLPRHSQLMQ